MAESTGSWPLPAGVEPGRNDGFLDLSPLPGAEEFVFPAKCSSAKQRSQHLASRTAKLIPITDISDWIGPVVNNTLPESSPVLSCQPLSLKRTFAFQAPRDLTAAGSLLPMLSP